MVSVKGASSGQRAVMHGVLQGLILGLCLHKIVTNTVSFEEG